MPSAGGQQPLWEPSPEQRENAEMTRFAAWAAQRSGRALPDYEALRRWSVEQLEDFWAAIWDYAGVRASRAAEWLKAPADHAGRVQVLSDLTIPGHPDIFAIGDTVVIAGPDGKPVPGIAPAAKQQGRYVAEAIRARLRGDAPAPFRYKHSGSLAQIGKRKAVIDFGWIKLRGALAWWIWGIAHIYFLIGLRHRLSVALSWLWIYTRDQRAARLITQGSSKVMG